MRLFTAIDIPSDIRERLRKTLNTLTPLAKLTWAKPEKLHITTKFIGEWPEPKLNQLTQTLDVVKSPSKITITVKGLDWLANGRVFYASIEASPGLAALAAATESALAAIGVPVEDREYHPHLTLGRRKDRVPLDALNQAIKKLPSLDFGTFTPDSFVLFLSAGGRYTPLKEFPLH
jgi:RNA 2',3'-cyclic 3'-phosphodiesterase